MCSSDLNMKKTVFAIISASSDRILTNLISLESSRRELSNGGRFISVASILTELHYTEYLIIF